MFTFERQYLTMQSSIDGVVRTVMRRGAPAGNGE